MDARTILLASKQIVEIKALGLNVNLGKAEVNTCKSYCTYLL